MAIKVVGLTGGIGSGKSAAASRFAELGIAVIDTDQISHQLTGIAGAAIPAIHDTFGSQLINAEGALDRQAMRQLVFADAAARQRLEAILHPMIRQHSTHLLQQAQGPYAILVVPLLFETGHYLAMTSRTLLVDCSEAQQLARVMQRNQLSADAVRAIMATQLSRQQRCTLADDIIANNDTLAALRQQVDAKHRDYVATLANRPLQGSDEPSRRADVP
ncbi:dephospho-CoA kinase [Neisseriaceae bacterium TC5R-5]|nr:dephospho-CoA kinase [Neisseriaceae bacterium TC5R-5]